MTYAIFKAAGFQYRAELGDILRLPSLNAKSGETVTFNEVLLGAADDEVLVGRPTLEGAAVRAQVLRHGRADKVIVFKFKRRKNYRRKSGHRQNYTEVRVSEIDLGGSLKVSLEADKKPKAKRKAEPKAEAAAKPAAKKPAAKKPAARKAAPKKAAEKKPAEKKAAEKKAAAKPKAEAAKKTTTKAGAKAKDTKSKKKS